MKIAWVSSWPPRPCGIATYSTELVHHLRKMKNEVHILCHTDGGSPGEKNVYPVIDIQKAGWDEKLYSTVKDIKPDVVHIQHEYGLYKTNKDYAVGLFRPLFRWNIENKFPVVITYHSVYVKLNQMMSLYMNIMQKLIDGGIVHEPYQWIDLPVNIGYVPDNVYVIPHGAKEGIKISKSDAKGSFDLTGKKVVGMIGWFTQTKGFHRVIARWDSISEKLGPDTVLLIAGEARRFDPLQLEYKNRLLKLIEKSGYEERVKVILGSFSPQEYEKILASFDVMVMPYSFASQSGNMAHSFSLGVPVIATDLEGLKAEVEKSGAGMVVPPEDDEELERAIVAIMSDDTMREKYSKKANNYVKKEISWRKVVEKHTLLYKKLIKKKKQKEKDSFSEAFLEL